MAADRRYFLRGPDGGGALILRWPIALMSALAVLSVAGIAMACPVCATSEASGSDASVLLLGLFIAAPFVIGGLAAVFVVRAMRRS